MGLKMSEFRVEKDSMGEVKVPAQAYYGAIVGNVTDSTGAAIVGATVTATATATNAQSSTTTSSIGAFSLAQLPVGLYTVRITQSGDSRILPSPAFPRSPSNPRWSRIP